MTAINEKGKKFCPVCERVSVFQAYGSALRENAKCPRCGALERHRLSWIFMGKKTNLFDGKPKRMLHVAPEPCFMETFRKIFGSGYVPADLSGSIASVKMDVSDIRFPDGYFDVVYCSHVLEHVPDDRKAMRELRRVLKPTGWGLIIAPTFNMTTIEDPTITDPKELLKRFGQRDHVRRYGNDYVDRLREAGFAVETFQVGDLLDKHEAERTGLYDARCPIHYCTRAA